MVLSLWLWKSYLIFLRASFLICSLDCKKLELEDFKMAVPGYKTFFDYMIPKMFVLVNIEISSKLWGEAILGKVLRRKTVQVECCR